MNIFDLNQHVRYVGSVDELVYFFKTGKESWVKTTIQDGVVAILRLQSECLSGCETLLVAVQADLSKTCLIQTREGEAGFGQFYILLWATPGTFVSKGAYVPDKLNTFGEMFIHGSGDSLDLSVGNKNGGSAFAVFIASRVLPKPQNRHRD